MKDFLIFCAPIIAFCTTVIFSIIVVINVFFLIYECEKPLLRSENCKIVAVKESEEKQ
jgi:hypothetical protein